LTKVIPGATPITVSKIGAVWVRLPEVPVTVMVAAPVTALAAAVKLRTDEPDAAPAVNEPVTPAGRPERFIVTVPAKPFCGVTVKIVLAVLPARMLRLAGEAVIVNDGGAVMVSATTVLLVSAPEAPVIVIVEVPARAVLAAARVSVALPVVLAGLKLAVTPLARPLALSDTLPLKPFSAFTAMVLVAVPPGTILRVAGPAESEKPGGGVTISAIVTVLVRLPETPVTVTMPPPLATELAAPSVKVLAVCVGFELKTALTPAGSPLAVKRTVLLKPYSGLTEIVLLTFPPPTNMMLAGAAERMKLGAGVTVSEIVAVLLAAPALAVMVRVAALGAAFAATLRVSVLVRLVDAGLNDPVTPAGKPETESDTFPLKPFCGATVMVLEPEPPCRIVRLTGDAVIE
jgi:hypothetical protein